MALQEFDMLYSLIVPLVKFLEVPFSSYAPIAVMSSENIGVKYISSIDVLYCRQKPIIIPPLSRQRFLFSGFCLNNSINPAGTFLNFSVIEAIMCEYRCEGKDAQNSVQKMLEVIMHRGPEAVAYFPK